MNPSSVPGVRWGRLVSHADDRGSFRELWRASAFDAIEAAEAGLPADQAVRFVQSNLSVSAPGVLRGLHLHRRQLDHWIVASGRAFVALVDVRPMLAGGAGPLVDAREVDANTTVSIPTGVAHGFLAIDRLELIYFVTNEYDGADELGFAWDDPDAAVPWPSVPGTPDGRPILSDRDLGNPSLGELVEQIRGSAGAGPRTESAGG
jgi:dTDP-4-dehydrorhamnose 3,5-epimerase